MILMEMSNNQGLYYINEQVLNKEFFLNASDEVRQISWNHKSMVKQIWGPGRV